MRKLTHRGDPLGFSGLRRIERHHKGAFRGLGLLHPSFLSIVASHTMMGHFLPGLVGYGKDLIWAETQHRIWGPENSIDFRRAGGSLSHRSGFKSRFYHLLAT